MLKTCSSRRHAGFHALIPSDGMGSAAVLRLLVQVNSEIGSVPSNTKMTIGCSSDGEANATFDGQHGGYVRQRLRVHTPVGHSTNCQLYPYYLTIIICCVPKG